jgi:hypothetical protein
MSLKKEYFLKVPTIDKKCLYFNAFLAQIFNFWRKLYLKRNLSIVLPTRSSFTIKAISTKTRFCANLSGNVLDKSQQTMFGITIWLFNFTLLLF